MLSLFVRIEVIRLERFKSRVKSRLPSAGIIKISPYSQR